ncbi:MAG: hypothetical protein V4530_13555 [Pseudomonadota bacterium]
MTATALAVLTPDPDDDGRYDDWRTQATQLERLLPDVPIVYRPWSSDAEPAALTLPLMTWGYHRHLDRWYAALDAWDAAGSHFANSVSVLRWNTDKAYLVDLAARGVGVVPTIDVTMFDEDALAQARAALGTAELVIKPPVSAGSDATFRLSSTDGAPPAVVGTRMLVQPLMPDILEHGELSLFYLGGTLAHAIVKRPKSGDFRVQPQFGGRASAIDPPAVARAAAEAALAASGPGLLYARVDLVPDGDDFRLMEIELIEPWLYLDQARDGGAAFANAIRHALSTIEALA